MSKDILRRTSLAAVVAFSALGAVSAPILADQAPTASPTETQNANDKKTTIVIESPLTRRDNFTPEVFLTVGGPAVVNFETDSQTQTDYLSVPEYEIDGIDSAITTNLMNVYINGLDQDNYLNPSDLTWRKITTPLSDSEKVYMTQSTSNSNKLDGLIVPGTLNAIGLYQDGAIIETYMEFQVPDLNLAQASDQEYFDALTTILKLPSTHIVPGTAEIPFTDPTSNGENSYVEKYFTILFKDGEFYTVAMINEFGNVHLLSSIPEVISQNLGFDVTTAE